MDIVIKVGQYAGVAAFLCLAFLIPLYLSQSRDVSRLRLWADQEPNAVQDAEGAMVATARAAQQAAVARVTGRAQAQRAEVHAAAQEAVAMERGAAARVAAERPGASRLTAERAALLHEPAWRRFLRRGPNARQLVIIVGVVFALGLGGIAGTLFVLSRGGGEPAPTTRAGVVPYKVKVASLNGTAVPGLAQKVADDVEANDYRLGAVTNSPTPANKSYVMFERGHEQEANAVASDLGIGTVRPIDGETRALAEDATVVVVAGEDRAGATGTPGG
jgi:LytR cell envelope-related transcriptional attenuator